jgi:four helix bundle protein
MAPQALCRLCSPELLHYDNGVRDHTSLRAWQEARQVALEVIKLARSSWKPYAAALFNQLQRASLSIQLNIAEGYTYGDSPTFTKHLGIAYGSAVETGELLQLASDAGLADRVTLNSLLDRTHETERILLGMLKSRRNFKS